MRSGGGSFARINLHVGADWWTFLSTYDEHSPILDIAAGAAFWSENTTLLMMVSGFLS